MHHNLKWKLDKMESWNHFGIISLIKYIVLTFDMELEFIFILNGIF